MTMKVETMQCSRKLEVLIDLKTGAPGHSKKITHLKFRMGRDILSLKGSKCMLCVMLCYMLCNCHTDF